MQIKNTTDIPTDVIRDIIRKIRPPGISNFDVMVKNTTFAGAGRCYSHGSSYHASASPFIVIRVARTDIQAQHRWHYFLRGGYLPHELGSRIETLLFILAHELRHLWQAKHRKGKVWGARGRYSERDADAYALGKLRRFRRGEL